MPPAEHGRHVPGWVLGCVLLALFAAHIAAFRPGVVTPDTVFQWSQALSGRYDDWHPPVTAWLWRQLMPLGPGTTPVLVFDCSLYWFGAGLCADVLRRRGQPWAMAAALIVAASPIPFGQLGAILKDPLLAACCMAAAGPILMLAESGANRERPGSRVHPAIAVAYTGFPPRAVATLLLILASATRVNALFATAPLFAAVLPVRFTAGPWRTLATLGGAAALLFGTTILIDRVALQPHHAQPIFSLVNFDLAGIVAHGDVDAYPNLPGNVARAITAHCYAPTLYNPHDLPECNRVEDRLVTFTAAHRLSPVSIWLGAIMQAPGAYARHRLAHLNHVWRLFVPAVPDDAVYVMSEPNRFGLRYIEGRGARLVARAAMWLAWSPLGRPATWIAVAAGLLMIGRRLPSRRFVLAAAASALAYGGAYAVISVAPDLRYNLWTMLAAAMALVVALAEIARDRSVRPARRRLLLATLPALLAVAVELVGLGLGEMPHVAPVVHTVPR